METAAANVAVVAAAEATNAKESDGVGTFNMRSLSAHLPYKRKGLSKFFSGKTRSFACIADAKCVEDLEKAELPEAKRRKYSARRRPAAQLLPPLSCRKEPSSASHCTPCGGV